MILANRPDWRNGTTVRSVEVADAQELRVELESFHRDYDAFDARREELLETHNNQWVSIHDDKVYQAADLHGLLALLRADGIDPAWVPREYISTDCAPHVF